MVFEANRNKQYARELLFSTVVELTTLVSLGLRPRRGQPSPARPRRDPGPASAHGPWALRPDRREPPRRADRP